MPPLDAPAAAPITIGEIARLAGVSKATASRVLNGKYKENRPAVAKRAQKVRDVAAGFGYRPNAAARSVSTGRFNAVAFVTCSETGADYFPRALLHGIHAGLMELGQRLVISEVGVEAIKDPDHVPAMFRESTVDALMVYPNPRFEEHVVPYFERQPQPTVWLNLKLAQNAAFPDEASGAEVAVQYLASQGKRRIGYFGNIVHPLGWHFSGPARRDGWEAAMKARRMSAKRTVVHRAEEGVDSTAHAAELFLDAFPDLDGVVCYEQMEATCLQFAALRRGRRVPQDLMIVAFHEGEVRATTGLTVPTVIVPFYQVGREAVAMLDRMLKQPRVRFESVAVPYTQVSE